MDILKLRLWWHRVTHWEYWPVYIVYAPTFLLWGWYVLKFRKFHFYKYANPTMKNGGFYPVHKKSIYSLIQKKYYPTTLYVDQTFNSDYQQLLKDSNLEFPLIVKPDNGFRGIMVQKVYSIKELEFYAEQLKEPFLVQEISPYENEMGLFYCRKPNEKTGYITGITVKKFLTITGDGEHTLEYLLQQNPRYAMQIEKLKGQYDLQTILAINQEICLVPFGNHNRGTEFLDGFHLITNKLQTTFNEILSKIDGFYYGRLDIRYRNFEELELGENFSIIEMNGAISEPTHIYDPKHSFWHGQKEIFRHQLLMHNIVELNLQGG